MTHLQRRLATGANGLLLAVFLTLTVGLLVELAAAHRLRWDLTRDGRATLSPQTTAVLAQVRARAVDVTITAFSAKQVGRRGSTKDRSVRELLHDLELAGLHTRFVDFDADRLEAEALGVDRYSTVVVQLGDDRVDLSGRELFRRSREGDDFLGEEVLTRALRQLLSDTPRKVYVLEGHGEHTVYDRGVGELKQLAELLGGEGWKVAPLNLLQAGVSQAPAVPEDASAVLVLGPKSPIPQVESAALAAFLSGGGRVGWWVDPGGVVPPWLASWGASVPEGVVLDEVALFPHQDWPLLRYRRHVITEPLLGAHEPTVAAHAAPLVLTERPGVLSSPLLVTSGRGWVQLGDAPAPAARGSIVVAAALQRGAARLLLVGDTDLFSDDLLAQGPGNATFVVNSLRWLVGAEGRVARVGRPRAVPRVAITSSQMFALRWAMVGGLPLLVVLLGLVVLGTRRGR